MTYDRRRRPRSCIMHIASPPRVHITTTSCCGRWHARGACTGGRRRAVLNPAKISPIVLFFSWKKLLKWSCWLILPGSGFHIRSRLGQRHSHQNTQLRLLFSMKIFIGKLYMYILMKVIFKTNIFIWFSHFQTWWLKGYSWFIFPSIFDSNLVKTTSHREPDEGVTHFINLGLQNSLKST
jgi:hypothetical protein